MSVSLMSSIDLGTVLYTGDADRVDLVAHKMHFFQHSFFHSSCNVCPYAEMVPLKYMETERRRWRDELKGGMDG